MQPDKTQNLYRKVQIGLMIVIALAIGYFVFLKPYLEKQKAIDNSDIDNKKTGKAKIYANELRAAFNPSGNNWMIDFDNTNEGAAYLVAAKIRRDKVKFADVAAAYYAAYNDDLTKRLQKELDSVELTKFYSYMGKS